MAGRVSCVYAYLSISTDNPDFNSTVQWSSQTVICLSQRLTRASSNSVRSAVCDLMKSCKSVMRLSCSSRCTVSIAACWCFSLRANIWSAIPSYLTIFFTLNDRELPISDADIFKAKIYKQLESDEKKLSLIDRRIWTNKLQKQMKIFNSCSIIIYFVFAL